MPTIKLNTSDSMWNASEINASESVQKPTPNSPPMKIVDRATITSSLMLAESRYQGLLCSCMSGWRTS